MKKQFLLSGLVICLFGCSSNDTQNTDYKHIKTFTVEKYTNNKVLQFPGRVVASEDISLSFRVNGQIDKILIREGDFIKKNEQIAQIIDTDYKLQLDATEAEYNQLKGDAERIMALYNDSATTKSVYDKARYGLEQITAKLKHHREQLAYTKLYAPFDGYVQKIHFNENEVVGAGMPVISILGANSYEVEINLPTVDYLNRESFDIFTCRTTLLGDKEIKLLPLSTIHKANANQLYTMKLGFVDDVNELSPGMTVCVTINLKENEEATKQLFLVPNNAIRTDNTESFVYKFDPSTSKAIKCIVNVKQLKTNGFSVIEADNLNDNDKIISAGVHHIDENDLVKPISEPSSTNVGGLL